MCPVSVSRSSPVAMFQILIVRSEEPSVIQNKNVEQNVHFFPSRFYSVHFSWPNIERKRIERKK